MLNSGLANCVKNILQFHPEQFLDRSGLQVLLFAKIYQTGASSNDYSMKDKFIKYFLFALSLLKYKK